MFRVHRAHHQDRQIVSMLRSKIENAHWAEKRPQRVVALEKQP